MRRGSRGRWCWSANRSEGSTPPSMRTSTWTRSRASCSSTPRSPTSTAEETAGEGPRRGRGGAGRLQALRRPGARRRATQDDPHGCFASGRTARWTREAYLVVLLPGPPMYEGQASEMMAWRSSPRTSCEERRAARRFGDLPMVVLTAGKPPQVAPTGRRPGRTSRPRHDRLAARSTRGSSIVVPDAGHFIQPGRPGRRDERDRDRPAPGEGTRPRPLARFPPKWVVWR